MPVSAEAAFSAASANAESKQLSFTSSQWFSSSSLVIFTSLIGLTIYRQSSKNFSSPEKSSRSVAIIHAAVDGNVFNLGCRVGSKYSGSRRQYKDRDKRRD